MSLIAATLAAPLLFAMQAAPPVADWNCEEPTRQQEMNWCAGEDHARADAALNAQWMVTSAKMKQIDANDEGSDDDRPGHFATLLAAERAWIAYRDAHCRSEGYYARGGSLEPLLVATCKTALTQLRTAQLASLANAPR